MSDEKKSARENRRADALYTSAGFRTSLMLLPALSVIVILFLGGLFCALLQSVGYFPLAGEHVFTLRHYRELFRDREFIEALKLTFSLTIISTIVSSVAGLCLALTLRELPRRFAFVKTLLQIPLAIPHLVMGLVIVNLIAPSGFVARLVYHAGLISTQASFPAFVADRYGLGIIIAYVCKETPFIALMTLAVLVRLDNGYTEVARTLGASGWQRLTRVTLPLVAPATLSAAVIVFAFIFGAFEIPFLLGRPYPAMLAVVAQKRFISGDLAERPAAMATALLITLIVALLALLYLRLTRAVLAGVERFSIF